MTNPSTLPLVCFEKALTMLTWLDVAGPYVVIWPEGFKLHINGHMGINTITHSRYCEIGDIRDLASTVSRKEKGKKNRYRIYFRVHDNTSSCGPHTYTLNRMIVGESFF